LLGTAGQHGGHDQGETGEVGSSRLEDFALCLGHGPGYIEPREPDRSAESRGHYILGEKLRDSRAAHKEALSFQVRYQKVRENLEIKDIVVGEGERRRRFILVYKPEQAKKHQSTPGKTLTRIEETSLAQADLETASHKKAVCALLSHRSMGR
jgi:hypothetical protein